MRDFTQDDGRKLSWLLRHGARESGLAMDPAGWAELADVRRLLRLDDERVAAAVADNTKGRLELDGARIRACQGHSLAGAPVTLEALEASWAPYTDDAPIWHGTNIPALPSIAREGLLPGARSHVHLAEATDSKVGKRSGVAVLLGIAPLRLRRHEIAVYRSGNGVLLARRVPPDCIVALRPMTRAAETQVSRLRALFGL